MKTALLLSAAALFAAGTSAHALSQRSDSPTAPIPLVRQEPAAPKPLSVNMFNSPCTKFMMSSWTVPEAMFIEWRIFYYSSRFEEAPFQAEAAFWTTYDRRRFCVTH